MLHNLLALFWNGLGTPLRRRLAWLANPKFTHGVSGIILDPDGRVLLLKHRFWQNQCWGLPGGMAHHYETLGETLSRELREEASLDITPLRLIQLRTGRSPQSQFTLLAKCSGNPVPSSPEILGAGFFTLETLPPNLLESHRLLIEKYFSQPDWPGLPLED